MNRGQWLVGALIACAGCGGGTTAMSAMPDTCMTGMEKGMVLTKAAFARQDKPGVSVGFDLDHYTATQGDPKTCGHASLKAPDGTPGIDNQLSTVLPAIDMQTKGALDGELQGAINDGMLLLGIDLQHVDDRMNDGCVDLTFYRLTGTPTVGTDQILDANQTFDIDKNGPVSHVQGAIKDGVLTAGPFELQLPVRILDANFTLAVHDTHIQMNLADDDALTGVIGGALTVNDVVNTLEMYAIGAQLKQMLPALLQGIADLDQDPQTMVCRQFSLAMTVSARNAFINH